jgi:hypothetical protein
MTSDSRTKPDFDKNKIFGSLSPIAHSFPENPQPKYRLQGGACTKKASSIVMPHVFTRKADYFWPFAKGTLNGADRFRLDKASYNNLLDRLEYPSLERQAYDLFDPKKKVTPTSLPLPLPSVGEGKEIPTVGQGHGKAS